MHADDGISRFFSGGKIAGCSDGNSGLPGAEHADIFVWNAQKLPGQAGFRGFLPDDRACGGVHVGEKAYFCRKIWME